MSEKVRFAPAGDRAMVLAFGSEISEVVNNRVRSMMLALEAQKPDGLIEMTPAYCSLMLHYDPIVTGYDMLAERVRTIEGSLESIKLPEPSVIEIPTLYGGEWGPDLEDVAAHNGLSVQDVIDIHAGRDYRIYMLGFTPGFPYLGGMDERIATPRLAVPRTKLPAGSVGIAGSQTGVYPIESPGGWRIIGRTPLKLYDPNRSEPILLRAGEKIRFRPIDLPEFNRLSVLEERGGERA